MRENVRKSPEEDELDKVTSKQIFLLSSIKRI